MVTVGTKGHCYIHLRNLTQRPVHHIEFEVLGFVFGFRKQQNAYSGSNNTSIFIDKVPFSLHAWTRLTDNNTNAKEEQV